MGVIRRTTFVSNLAEPPICLLRFQTNVCVLFIWCNLLLALIFPVSVLVIQRLTMSHDYDDVGGVRAVAAVKEVVNVMAKSTSCLLDYFVNSQSQHRLRHCSTSSIIQEHNSRNFPHFSNHIGLNVNMLFRNIVPSNTTFLHIMILTFILDKSGFGFHVVSSVICRNIKHLNPALNNQYSCLI